MLMRQIVVYMLAFGALSLGGCERKAIGKSLLSGGTYISADYGVRGPPGVELLLDMQAERAVLTTGERRVELRIERGQGKGLWQEGCRGGRHFLLLEYGNIAPTTFEIEGQSVTYHRISAHCSSGVVRLENTELGNEWRFHAPEKQGESE